MLWNRRAGSVWLSSSFEAKAIIANLNAFLPNIMKRVIYVLLWLMLCPVLVYCQQTVYINKSLKQHIFSYKEIEQLEDPSGNLTLKEILSPHYNHQFKASITSTPQNKTQLVYWFRIKINQSEPVQNNFLLEFFDQTIDDITAYIPQNKHTYKVIHLGDKYAFAKRQIRHKNFEIFLDNQLNKERIFYFRIKSAQNANVIIVLRSVNWFIQYALTEYFTFGVFYGMMLIFSFYNLVMFIYLRQRQYLYYVIYIISVGLYEMCIDGIAYQYLWPHSPQWNQTAHAVALCCMSVFALLFTQKLLHVKAKAPLFNRAINALIVLRIAVFVCFYFFGQQFLRYKFIDAIPLMLAFSTGLYIYAKGYKPARYFVIGYGFLFLGFLLKFMVMLGFTKLLNLGIISYYSLSFCFIAEMFFLSLAVGDSVRLLKIKKEKAQQKIIRQMQVNEQLKDTINKELEQKVLERSREIVEKSVIIEQQNNQLKEANERLLQQAGEISRMNELLEHDNRELKVGIEKVTRARVMSAEVDFAEFSKIYPDKESCFKFLAELKWSKGYTCKKCGNKEYIKGSTPYGRRCTNCSYDESVMIDTVFQNTRIPITKSFYIVFLVYTTKGKISSHKLSEILDIRQNTCWIFAGKIKTLMEQRKKELKNAGDEGWSKLVVNVF